MEAIPGRQLLRRAQNTWTVAATTSPPRAKAVGNLAAIVRPRRATFGAAAHVGGTILRTDTFASHAGYGQSAIQSGAAWKRRHHDEASNPSRCPRSRAQRMRRILCRRFQRTLCQLLFRLSRTQQQQQQRAKMWSRRRQRFHRQTVWHWSFICLFRFKTKAGRRWPLG